MVMINNLFPIWMLFYKDNWTGKFLPDRFLKTSFLIVDFSCILVELNTAHHYAECHPIPFLFLHVNEVR